MWEYNYNELYHYGIKGQRWGVRRYVNADGTLTPEGIARYGNIQDRSQINALKKQDKQFFRNETMVANSYREYDHQLMKRNDKAQKRYEKLVAKTKDLADTDVKVLKAKRKADEASGKLKEFDKKFDYIIKRAGDKDVGDLVNKARHQNLILNPLLVGPIAGSVGNVGLIKALEADYKKNQKTA